MATGQIKNEGESMGLGPYRRFYVRTWGDKGFRSLSPIPCSGQSLWTYLLTHPHSTAAPGFIPATLPGIAAERGWDLDAVERAWFEIESKKMAEADWSAGLVWLPRAVDYNPPLNPNGAKAWSKGLDLVPECDLKTKGIQALEAYLESKGPTFLESFREGLSHPSPNRDRERDRGKGIKKKGSKGTSRKVPGPEGEILRAFDEGHKRVLGAPYMMNGPRDVPAAKRAIKLYGQERLEGMMGIFWTEQERAMSCPNEFNPIGKAKPNFPGFLRQIENILKVFMPRMSHETQDRGVESYGVQLNKFPGLVLAFGRIESTQPMTLKGRVSRYPDSVSTGDLCVVTNHGDTEFFACTQMGDFIESEQLESRPDVRRYFYRPINEGGTE